MWFASDHVVVVVDESLVDRRAAGRDGPMGKMYMERDFAVRGMEVEVMIYSSDKVLIIR